MTGVGRTLVLIETQHADFIPMGVQPRDKEGYQATRKIKPIFKLRLCGVTNNKVQSLRVVRPRMTKKATQHAKVGVDVATRSLVQRSIPRPPMIFAALLLLGRHWVSVGIVPVGDQSLY
jgi:hypothetical protein